MITAQDMDIALKAWEEARKRATLEMEAWGAVLQSHTSLIESLRANGHTWSQAQTEFKRITDGHSGAVLEAWKAIDQRSCEYQILRNKFVAQKTDS